LEVQILSLQSLRLNKEYSETTFCGQGIINCLFTLGSVIGITVAVSGWLTSMPGLNSS